MSLEKYKKVFALKRKERRLQKSSERRLQKNKQEDQEQKIKQNKNKNKKQFTFIRVYKSNTNHVEGESVVKILETSYDKDLSVCHKDVISKLRS